MDDCFNSGKGICLRTESFSLSEVDLLRDILITTFDLIVILQVYKSSGGALGYKLYISSKWCYKLLSLVQPNFIPSMNYKLAL